MPRNCPTCKSEMRSDGVHDYCIQAGCTFDGYVVHRTGKIIRMDNRIADVVVREILETSDYDAVNGNWSLLVKSATR